MIVRTKFHLTCWQTPWWIQARWRGRRTGRLLAGWREPGQWRAPQRWRSWNGNFFHHPLIEVDRWRHALSGPPCFDAGEDADSEGGDEQGGDGGEEGHHRPVEWVLLQQLQLPAPLLVDPFEKNVFPAVQFQSLHIVDGLCWCLQPPANGTISN